MELEIEFERYRCPACGRTHTPKLPHIERRARISDRLRESIAHIVRTFSCAINAVARWLRMSWGTAWRALAKLRPLTPQELGGARNLCIDEVFYREPRRFLTVLSDAERSQVLGVVYGKGYNAAHSLLSSIPEELRKKVDTISTDFASGHRKAAEELLPDALVVADRFHLERIARMRTRLTPKEMQIYVRHAVNELHDILDKGGNRAIAALTDWILKCRCICKTRRLDQLNLLLRLIDRWRIEIEAYLTTGRSNGPAEALNRKIALLRRNAYGYTNLDNFIKRIFLLNHTLHPQR
jgi:transposase